MGKKRGPKPGEASIVDGKIVTEAELEAAERKSRFQNMAASEAKSDALRKVNSILPDNWKASLHQLKESDSNFSLTPPITPSVSEDHENHEENRSLTPSSSSTDISDNELDSPILTIKETLSFSLKKTLSSLGSFLKANSSSSKVVPFSSEKIEQNKEKGTKSR